MLMVSFNICIWVAESTSYDDNRYASKNTKKFLIVASSIELEIQYALFGQFQYKL